MGLYIHVTQYIETLEIYIKINNTLENYWLKIGQRRRQWSNNKPTSIPLVFSLLSIALMGSSTVQRMC